MQPLFRMFRVGFQCCSHRLSGEVKDQSPLRDAVPARLLARCWLPRNGTLDAGFGAVQVVPANPGRSGALVILLGRFRGQPVCQLNDASYGGSHEVASGRGRHGLTG
jgi:hypothetical protein